MMKLPITVFLAGLLGCWSSSSPLPNRRMHHRSLQSDECLDATLALSDNAALQSANDASVEDTAGAVSECFANLASGGGGGGDVDCTVDAAGLPSTTALEEACQDAGGQVFVVDITNSCTIDGTGTMINGGIINDVYCLGTPCTRDEVESGIEDSSEVDLSPDISGVTCTTETSVESGASPTKIKLWSVVMLVAGVVGSGLTL